MSLTADLAAAAIVVIALPTILAAIGLRWRKSRRLRPLVLHLIGISPSHSVASGWNEAFSREGQMKEMMVRATMKDGRVVGGYFRFGSLAGYSEHTQDLFIAERWSLDDQGWFEKRAEGTEGVCAAGIHLKGLRRAPANRRQNLPTLPQALNPQLGNERRATPRGLGTGCKRSLVGGAGPPKAEASPIRPPAKPADACSSAKPPGTTPKT
jgi:hypothetical protein